MVRPFPRNRFQERTSDGYVIYGHITPRCGKACGKRTLQRLRREAGYASAKEFAAVLNIPNSTYSRYERAPEGPNSGIPLSAAWAMADELGSSHLPAHAA